ncbi:gamma-glutamyl kinase [Pseudoruegeria sp. SHC-113]|uniref:gamma-glutamyl kinase n=1 Tax=Pseudoruegeria sp. SHC-113 TaxID=2855439 RepID=UPI0021BAD5A9|nr:gamma-glutamyl kinase [Pseudoruegeria sp. SHC-113]MCT8160540.1 gamma-glutamyl kinase [Pseudoruegeria sp. SHC-113]
MLVFNKERLVILSVPKTGSTALQAALGDAADLIVRDPPLLKHAPLYRYHRFFKPMLEKFCGPMELVAVIREPLDWMGSWYRYRARPYLSGTENSTEEIDFGTFLTGYMSDPKPPYAEIGAQSKFVARKDGTPGVDHLFAYEEPEHLQRFLEERLERSLVTERLNVSPPRVLDAEAEVIARFRERHKAEFDLWNSARRGNGVSD